jgi:hypothetical protein
MSESIAITPDVPDDGPGPVPPPPPPPTNPPLPGEPGGPRAPADGLDVDPLKASLEELLRDAAARLASLESALGALSAAVQRVERAQRIDLAVRLARAADAAAAADAVEQVMRQRNLDDIAGALAEVRRMRPGLFRMPASVGAMAAALEAGGAPAPSTGGDRRAVMAYLRTRRGG